MNAPLFVFLVIIISATIFQGVMGYTKFSGIRLFTNTVQHAFYLNELVGIFETLPDGGIVNCEFVFVESEEEIEDILKIANLNNTREAKFEEFMHLLELCEALDSRKISEIIKLKYPDLLQWNQNHTHPFFIAKGTLWCGKGNIASHFYDLGDHMEVDKCCRTHDFCPISVRPGDTNYGVTNHRAFQLSDCACDDHFKKCLNKVEKPVADLIGNTYFNMLKMKCLVRRTFHSEIREAEEYVPSLHHVNKTDSVISNVFDLLLG